MRIINAGYNYKHSGDFVIDRPRGSGDYLLLIVRSSAFFDFNGTRFFTEPNTAVLLKKGTPQYYGARNGEYLDDWLHFEPEEEELEEFESLEIPFDTPFPVYDVSTLSSFVKNIVHERHSQNRYKEKTLLLYFELLLLKLSEERKLPEEKKESRYYWEFSALRNEIYRMPEKEWNLPVICKRLNLSRSYVQHLYKAFFGTGIVSDIKNSRMEYAKYLLSGSRMTVAEIARQCGYGSDVHFMRMFKEAFGVTPSRYRERIHTAESERKEGTLRSPHL